MTWAFNKQCETLWYDVGIQQTVWNTNVTWASNKQRETLRYDVGI